jgi:hypothetical protein
MGRNITIALALDRKACAPVRSSLERSTDEGMEQIPCEARGAIARQLLATAATRRRTCRRSLLRSVQSSDYIFLD